MSERTVVLIALVLLALAFYVEGRPAPRAAVVESGLRELRKEAA